MHASAGDVDRREFLRMAGLGSATLGAVLGSETLVARTARGALAESVVEYGGFLVERVTTGQVVYQYDPARLKAMPETLTVFSRNHWDPVRQSRPELTEDLARDRLVRGHGTIPNQTRLDYALMTAAWATATMDGGGQHYAWSVQTGQVQGLARLDPWDPADLGMSWDDARRAVKHAALFYGASLSGVAALNPLWLYSDHHTPTGDDPHRAIPVVQDGERFEQTDQAWYIPASMNRVVALAFEEDYWALANSPGRLASAAVGNGYSRMANTAFFMAEFIRALGYRALPAGNGVGLSIPIAVDAGLGQVGRMGLLVTPKYGPRVRLAKVITDMPLTVDAPIDFGVVEFCEACKLCATHCPSGAISDGPRTWAGQSPSNNPGTLKWYASVERCYDYNGFSCSNCKRVCPFNKPNNSEVHRLTRSIIRARARSVDSVMVSLDQASGYGAELEDTEFWKMDGQKSITAREKME